MREQIDFNVPPIVSTAWEYMRQAVEKRKICGDGEFTRLCHKWLEERTSTAKALMTTSCTHALEMAVLLSDINDGDEVILPSYTFASTADAVVLRGATAVFVDIRPDTMNIDENLIEAAVTEKTKAIIPVHYAGVSCDMDKIMDIAKRRGLIVIEDAAQGIMSLYKGRPLGAIGDFGCYSFHETKNYSMGEGGALLIQSPKHIERAEIHREKGTDRSRYLRGELDKYTWQDKGSSYLPSDLNAAYLWAQFEIADEINKDRLKTWDIYYDGLQGISGEGLITLPFIPDECTHNAHMFYIKVKDINERVKLIGYLKNRGVLPASHYIPLHSAPAGIKMGRFCGEDVYTTKESERILRLPLYYGIREEEVKYVIDTVKSFFLGEV